MYACAIIQYYMALGVVFFKNFEFNMASSLEAVPTSWHHCPMCSDFSTPTAKL